MKKYKVISSFVDRDEDGTITGLRPQIGDRVPVPDNQVDRLKTAECIVEIEDRIKRTPENRGKRAKTSRRNNG